MIIDKQYQEQLPIFHPMPRHTFAHKKMQHVMEYAKGRDKVRSNLKRLSCHNISRESVIQIERPKEKPCFNNKILDHILGNIKQKYKSNIRQKQQKDSTTKNRQTNQKHSNTSQDLNCSNNLKIISINNVIKPKNTKNGVNKTASVPFKNKKLMNLRKGKSYKLYTQQIQNQIHQNYNQTSILPWDQSINNILPWEEHSKTIKKSQEEEQNLEESYLKSHQIELIPKSNTLHLQNDKSIPFQKYSTLQITQYNKIKQQLTNAHIFSSYSIKQNPSKNQHNKNNKQQFNRALTQMKMEIDQVNLSANHQSYSKDINIESFFQLIKPSHKRQRKYSINPPSKKSHSYRKDSLQNANTIFLMSGKKYDRV